MYILVFASSRFIWGRNKRHNRAFCRCLLTGSPACRCRWIVCVWLVQKRGRTRFGAWQKPGITCEVRGLLGRCAVADPMPMSRSISISNFIYYIISLSCCCVTKYSTNTCTLYFIGGLDYGYGYFVLWAGANKCSVLHGVRRWHAGRRSMRRMCDTIWQGYCSLYFCRKAKGRIGIVVIRIGFYWRINLNLFGIYWFFGYNRSGCSDGVGWIDMHRDLVEAAASELCQII